MSRDEDDKAYSVFYLDVRCNVASPSSWFVYRRYSQFRRLSDVLRSEGYSVPILPSKKLLGTFSPEFIKQRRADLESWLYNLAEMHVTHPGAKDVQGQSYYRKFLTEDANKPPLPLKRIYPENTEVAPAKGEADFDDMALMGESGKVKVSIDDFDLVKVIGKGSFGKVTLVRKKTDKKLYAMKVLNKADIVKRKQVEHTRTERRVLGSINHPFIVRLHYAFQTEEKLYFVLDYAAGGELFFHLSRLKKFPEATTRFYCAELTLALDELHKHVRIAFFCHDLPTIFLIFIIFGLTGGDLQRLEAREHPAGRRGSREAGGLRAGQGGRGGRGHGRLVAVRHPRVPLPRSAGQAGPRHGGGLVEPGHGRLRDADGPAALVHHQQGEAVRGHPLGAPQVPDERKSHRRPLHSGGLI
jgi:hypothetical protein